jgi:hypothetical protein
MTPTSRLTMAMTISAVTANFGTAERLRSMREGIPAGDEADERPRGQDWRCWGRKSGLRSRVVLFEHDL